MQRTSPSTITLITSWFLNSRGVHSRRKIWSSLSAAAESRTNSTVEKKKQGEKYRTLGDHWISSWIYNQSRSFDRFVVKGAWMGGRWWLGNIYCIDMVSWVYESEEGKEQKLRINRSNKGNNWRLMHGIRGRERLVEKQTKNKRHKTLQV